MHSSRSAACTDVQQQTTSRAPRISFPPTPRFSLPDSTDASMLRSEDQKANLLHSWDEARKALTVK